ncbi:hypothetical protein ABIF38_003535 [Bradyrhizobium japonicum]|jgi:hypothetical protein|uniref:Uncharacterized protein n=1 Tax=Bradyrhizobium elkanii TaxID=29448 RepID=A0ABV4F9X8_BRAEL|nr:hypothetical protein [Bradyrhizobium elkanii]MDH6688928.1 hypothetical protein [Bradyrhizobium elkanii]NWL39171.1 hypothetical protein [Bradyrhizobium elkanii]NWL68708.1 hypothetical protein [Bradyrhizobium elkanii]OIM89155.1 hypothetical protein BLN97_41040 [Bradyrhizobium elkanii]RYM16459.1 hypothetical protein EWH13_42695 [Bradyrhizobium elkanii]
MTVANLYIQAFSNASLDERRNRRHAMSQANRNANLNEPIFHPVSHYNSPGDVLNDARLSTDEKRVILSSWASDMYVIESQPTLREIPGIPHRLRLADILAALKRLDSEEDPPPRGGMAMQLPRLSKPVRAVCDSERHAATKRHRPLRVSHADARWTREANVRRYRRLLDTQLTDAERNFIRRRLVEELKGLIASRSERRHTN